MDELPHRKTLIALAALLVGAAIVIPSIFLGGQTSKILSTVGGAIGHGVDGGTGSGSGSGGGAGADAGPTAAPGNGGQVADAAAATVPTLLIVRTGELAMEVADLGSALRDGDAAVIRAGGYVSGSNRTAKGGDESAQVTYRIPSARWDATLDTLHGIASKVDQETIKTDEVTGQVVDLTARIANLRATEAALQTIMTKAAKISDVLDVQKQLTATRGEIERLVADKQHLEDQASFGSLAVTLHLPVVPKPAATPAPVKGWDPGADVERATDKLVRIGQTATTAGIWFGIVGIPLLLSLAIGLLLLRLAWLAIRRTGLVGGSGPA